MKEFFHLILVTFATLFPITNPLGNAAIFLSITKGQSSAQKHRQAFMGSLYMFFILEGFFLGGSYIINFFGLSMPGIRIAGGLVVTKIGFNLLTPKQEQTHSEEENQEAKRKSDISFSPLAIPLLAGPGAIASIMGMASLLPPEKVVSYFAVSIGILLASITCWGVLRKSEWITQFLGVNGSNALTKIMGFLLLCIGVQLLIDGILAVLPN